MANAKFEILLVCTPGLEAVLAAEAAEQRFALAGTRSGAVLLNGTWRDVWRANLNLRGAGAVLARIGTFRASHLSELDKRLRKFPWAELMPRRTAVSVSATCHASRIYHSGAVKLRLENALREEAGLLVDDAAPLEVMARIDKEICTLSLNTSGTPLHKRGHKAAVGKAPLRETMAALILRACGFKGDEPVLDPMCGSGTFVLEAAEIAAGLAPGRDREFAFSQLRGFDPVVWAELKANSQPHATALKLFGFDRNAGAVTSATSNAARAGIAEIVQFRRGAISQLQRPEGAPGLVVTNPPYGGRIGDVRTLRDLYQTFGKVMSERFSGWRVGLVTNDDGLAKATGLPISKVSPTILHGGIRIRIYQTDPLV